MNILYLRGNITLLCGVVAWIVGMKHVLCFGIFFYYNRFKRLLSLLFSEKCINQIVDTLSGCIIYLTCSFEKKLALWVGLCQVDNKVFIEE